jgi:hypothetical protein
VVKVEVDDTRRWSGVGIWWRVFQGSCTSKCSETFERNGNLCIMYRGTGALRVFAFAFPNILATTWVKQGVD